MKLQKLYDLTDQYLKEATLNLIDKQGGYLLDLGCGDCKFTQRLGFKMNPIETCVVDVIDVRVVYAELNGWLAYKADLNKPLPFQDSCFDVIHAGDVIEHLNDTDNLIKEIKRILKPDGYALISTPNLASWHNVIALALGKQPLTCMVSDEIRISDIEADQDMPKHRRIFTFEGLKRLIEYHGMKIDRSVGVGFYPFTGIAQSFLSSIDRNHSAYILVKVNKDGLH